MLPLLSWNLKTVADVPESESSPVQTFANSFTTARQRKSYTEARIASQGTDHRLSSKHSGSRAADSRLEQTARLELGQFARRKYRSEGL